LLILEPRWRAAGPCDRPPRGIRAGRRNGRKADWGPVVFWRLPLDSDGSSATIAATVVEADTHSARARLPLLPFTSGRVRPSAT